VLEILQTTKGGKERERIFAVPDRSAFEGDLQDVRRLPVPAVGELAKFSKLPTRLKIKLQFLRWHGPTHAIKTVK
jgi:hypothetical protein